MNDLLDGLVAVVQYRHKSGSVWLTMAAFDGESPAKIYAKRCAGDNLPWDYQVINIGIGDVVYSSK